MTNSLMTTTPVRDKMNGERTEIEHVVLSTDLIALERHLTGLLYAIWKLTGQNKRILKQD